MRKTVHPADTTHVPGSASYLTLEEGTPVFDCFGLPVGDIERVLIASGSFFDGVIVCTRAGRRFVDAPEVDEITPARVRLTTGCHDVEHPGEPRVLGAHTSRREPGALSDEDRAAVIEALKIAFVRDMIDADGLAAAVERVHRATSPEQLANLIH